MGLLLASHHECSCLDLWAGMDRAATTQPLSYQINLLPSTLLRRAKTLGTLLKQRLLGQVSRGAGALWVGSGLDGWVVGERLGAGGMGTVYRAVRGEQVAALKVVHPGLAADEEFIKRFRREVSISQIVQGPRTARVIDYNVDGPNPWLATQLLEGPTLAQAVARGGLFGGDDLADIAVGIAEGISDLHSVGVIHRDVKPGNVVLTADGPVLVDFGIAAAAELTSMTGTSLRIGSAGWMSPEQVEGRRVGPETDVFSWGVTVAYAANGANPYGTGAPEAMLYRIVQNAPDLHGLPPLWMPIVRAALERRPQDRPTAFELLDLARSPEAAAELLPTVAQPSFNSTAVETAMLVQSGDATVTAPPTPRRSWLALTAVGAVSLVVIAGIVGVMLLRNDVGAANDRSDAHAAVTTPARVEGSPSGPSATGAVEAALPLYQADVDADRPAALAEFGEWFDAQVQSTVRLDVEFEGREGALEGTDNGGVVAYARCAPDCRVEDIQGLIVSISGLDQSPDATSYGLAGMWRITGTFFVQDVTIENSGIYQVLLRVAGTESPDPPQSAATNETPTNRATALPCQEYVFNNFEEVIAAKYPGYPLSTDLSGQYDQSVAEVQEFLVGAGVTDLCKDGDFGPKTESAVRAFQQQYGLPVTGVVDADTYEYMRSLVISME